MMERRQIVAATLHATSDNPAHAAIPFGSCHEVEYEYEVADAILAALADEARGQPFGSDGHYWQAHQRTGFARWLKDTPDR